MKGNTSSYSIWVAMDEESKSKMHEKKPLAYKNILQRVIKLEKAGYLEEIKFELVNMHGRRDYKVTIKGLEQLLFHLFAHPKEIHDVSVYMDKVKLDKRPFTLWLFNMSGIIDHLLNLHRNDIEDEIDLKWKGNRVISAEYKRK